MRERVQRNAPLPLGGIVAENFRHKRVRTLVYRETQKNDHEHGKERHDNGKQVSVSAEKFY